jgi:hypothetical protein
MKKNNNSKEPSKRAYEIWRIANTAVKKAQQRNRELGIPNVYSFNGKLYYENKDGDLVKGSPFKDLQQYSQDEDH